jgi:hypothetical protein
MTMAGFYWLLELRTFSGFPAVMPRLHGDSLLPGRPHRAHGLALRTSSVRGWPPVWVFALAFVAWRLATKCPR